MQDAADLVQETLLAAWRGALDFAATREHCGAPLAALGRLLGFRTT